MDITWREHYAVKCRFIYPKAQKLTEPLLSIHHVSYAYERCQILQDISFNLHRGEITTVIGPNGAGKSTLVRILTGLISDFSGSVVKPEKTTIGYCPQKIHLNPLLPLNVADFLALPDKTSKHEILLALQNTGVDYLFDRSIHDLSGGELQRVLLSRAILRKPDLLILDEPTSGVDITGEAEMYALITQLKNDMQCGVLLVSHELHLVMSQTDQVICLNGHICCSGQPEMVQQHPEYLAMFGQASEALAVYRHHHNHSHDLSGCAESEHSHG